MAKNNRISRTNRIKTGIKRSEPRDRIERVQQEISTWLPARADYEVDSSDYQDVRTRLAAADAPTLRRHRTGDAVGGPTLRRVRLGEDTLPTENRAMAASTLR